MEPFEPGADDPLVRLDDHVGAVGGSLRGF
jgi:hypothetical protein